jgi:hypothetical protein
LVNIEKCTFIVDLISSVNSKCYGTVITFTPISYCDSIVLMYIRCYQMVNLFLHQMFTVQIVFPVHRELNHGNRFDVHFNENIITNHTCCIYKEDNTALFQFYLNKYYYNYLIPRNVPVIYKSLHEISNGLIFSSLRLG